MRFLMISSQCLREQADLFMAVQTNEIKIVNIMSLSEHARQSVYVVSVRIKALSFLNDVTILIIRQSKQTTETTTQYDTHLIHYSMYTMFGAFYKKVQVGKDQEKAQSEKDSHSKNRGGKKPN